MVKHFYVQISTSAILVLLVIITLTPHCRAFKNGQEIVKSHSNLNHGRGGHARRSWRSGGNKPGQDGPGNNKPRCADLGSQLTGFYAKVYDPRPELGYLLMNLAPYTNLSELDPADVPNYKCLRVKDASEEDFAAVGLVTCNLTDQTQVVQILSGDYGLFFATNANATKGLTVDSGSLEENALVNQYQLQNVTTKSQQFGFTTYLDDMYAFVLESTLSTGKCLTPHDDNMTLTTCGNMSDISNFPTSQLWVMISSQARVLGQLKNRLLNKCLRADSDNADSDFAEVDFQVCNSSDAAQIIKLQWTINSRNQQAIEFSTGKVLSVVGPSISSNAPVKQMTRFYFGNQVWVTGAKTDGWFRVRNYDTTAYCLGVAANSSDLEMQVCGDTTTAKGIDAVAQQFWTFIPNP